MAWYPGCERKYNEFLSPKYTLALSRATADFAIGDESVRKAGWLPYQLSEADAMSVQLIARPSIVRVGEQGIPENIEITRVVV